MSRQLIFESGRERAGRNKRREREAFWGRGGRRPEEESGDGALRGRKRMKEGEGYQKRG